MNLLFVPQVVVGYDDDPAMAADRAAAAFLARYGGVTRRNYTSDLRQWFRWCALHGIEVMTVGRVQIETRARDMEETRRRAWPVRR